MSEELLICLGGHMDGKQIWVKKGVPIYRCFEPSDNGLPNIPPPEAKIIEYVRQTFAGGSRGHVITRDYMVMRGYEPPFLDSIPDSDKGL